MLDLKTRCWARKLITFTDLILIRERTTITHPAEVDTGIHRVDTVCANINSTMCNGIPNRNIPAYTTHPPNAGPMLARRQRRRPSSSLVLGRCVLFAGMEGVNLCYTI